MAGDRIRQQVRGGGDWGGNADLSIGADDLARVRAILDGMRPGEVQNAELAFRGVAERLRVTAELLKKQISRLQESWSGATAETALPAFQHVHAQATEISLKSSQVSTAMAGHAELMSRYRNNPPEGHGAATQITAVVLAGPLGGGAARAHNNELADQYMTRLQNDTRESNNRFPETIEGVPRKLGKSKRPDDESKVGGDHDAGGEGSGGGGLPGGTGVGAPGSAESDNPPAGAGTSVGGGSPQAGATGATGATGAAAVTAGGDGTGGDTDLAGLSGGPGVPGGGGGGAGLGGGVGAGGGGVGGGGLGGGPSAGLGVGVVPPGGAPGRGVGAGKGAGERGDKATKKRSGAGGGVPMGGSGADDEGETERERTTWLNEDEDVWTGDDDAVPPVIG
jgi:uncharacterized protein YukE